MPRVKKLEPNGLFSFSFSFFRGDIVVVVIPFILCVVLYHLSILRVDSLARVTTGERLHNLPSAVHALIFIARRVQPSLFLVDRQVYRILCTHDIILIVLHVLGYYVALFSEYFCTIHSHFLFVLVWRVRRTFSPTGRCFFTPRDHGL